MKHPPPADVHLAQKAYDLIRDRILRGKFPLGTSISRRDLSEEFGMSMLPISEGLKRLQHEGLIEAVPRVGTVVRIPTPQDIRGFYIVREALESQAARLFVDRASASERAELLELALELDQAYKLCAASSKQSDQQIIDLRTQHMRFHLRVAEGSKCPLLYDAIEKNQILVFNFFFDRLFGSPGLPNDWHGQLARELGSGEVEAADAAMRKHVRFRLEELQMLLEPFFSLNGEHLAKALNGKAAKR